MRELQNSNPQTWFAIQLVVSDRPFNLETMPRLDVFTAYRLYAIQGRLGTNACHALRLGFFAEQQLARTLCDDMQALFRFASVVQVTAAEQARFKKAPDQAVAPEKSPQASAEIQASAEVVEIGSARQAAALAVSVAPQSKSPAKKPAGNAGARKKFTSLSQELMAEARDIELARSQRISGKQAAAQTGSWLSRLLGRSDS